MQTLSEKPVHVCAVNSVTTRTTRWQQRCWEMAEAGLPFELRDVETKHFRFCHWIRAEYDYTFVYKYAHGNSVAAFRSNDSITFH